MQQPAQNPSVLFSPEKYLRKVSAADLTSQQMQILENMVQLALSQGGFPEEFPVMVDENYFGLL